MRRREFITLLGGASVWPLAARAQQPGKLPTIGFLGTSSASGWGPWNAAFVQRLRELGWIEGRTVEIEYRWAEGRSGRYLEIAAEFVRFKVDVIVTAGNATLEVQRATSTIPIVSAITADPVGAGLVGSLSRPGGNVTGLSVQRTDTAGKRLEILREVVPGLRRLAILANVGFPDSVQEMDEVQATANTLGLATAKLEIRRAEDIAPALRGAKERCGCALCLQRRAHKRQPDSYQYVGARRATTDDARRSGVRGSGWSDVLWTRLPGPVPPHSRLCRQNPARGKAKRPPSRAADQVRFGHQSDHRQGAQPRSVRRCSRVLMR